MGSKVFEFLRLDREKLVITVIFLGVIFFFELMYTISPSTRVMPIFVLLPLIILYSYLVSCVFTYIHTKIESEIGRIVSLVFAGIMLFLLINAVFVKPVSEKPLCIWNLRNHIEKSAEKPATLRTADVKFYDGEALTTEKIAKDISLNSNQLCLGVEEFESRPDWEVSGDKSRIAYMGEGAFRAEFLVMCENGLSNLKESIDEYSRALDLNLSSSDIKGCECSETEICCAAIVKKEEGGECDGLIL